MDSREIAGVRRAITWLHERAVSMNDPQAVLILNSAAFNLGVALREWSGRSLTAHHRSISEQPNTNETQPDRTE